GEPNKTALSVEYFAFQTEDLWPLPDERLRGTAVAELCDLGLLDPRAVEAAWVLRETESYPTYYMGFQGPYNVLRARLAEFDNVSSIGRGGMYRYNNQDYAAMTGLLAARKYLRAPGALYDVWDVNTDAEYHGAARATG